MKFKPKEISFINEAITLQARINAEIEFKDMKDYKLNKDSDTKMKINEVINKYAKEEL